MFQLTDSHGGINSARNFLYQRGLDLRRYRMPVQLIDNIPAPGNYGLFERPISATGRTDRYLERVGRRIVAKQDCEIIVAVGLVYELFMAVLVHEYTHCWLFLNNYHNWPPELEEGLCLFMETDWLRQYDSEMARYQLHTLEVCDEPAIDDAFNVITHLAETKSLRQVIDIIAV